MEIKKLTVATIDDFAAILWERNRTIPEYVYWKYPVHDGLFRGVVGYNGKKPVGCFGIIPMRLRISDEHSIEVGWLTDWYVSTTMRGTKLGLGLMLEVSKGYPINLGHLSPDHARNLCLNNGYRLLDQFQRRRQVILKPLAYAHTRTRYSPKALFIALKYIHSAYWEKGKLGQEKSSIHEPKSTIPFFEHMPQYQTWILSQPVASWIKRTSGIWKKEGLEIVYIDDELSQKIRRRRVLYTAGERRFSPEAWKSFIETSRHENCTLVEMFTSEPKLDAAWVPLGGLPVTEKPFIISNIADAPTNLLLHAWDRENWTYQASAFH